MGQVLCGYNINEGHNYDHESFGDEGMSKLPSNSPNSKASRSSSSRSSSFSRPRNATKLNPRERARAAIIGGFVADAATMPLHLIYDQIGLGMLLDGINHSNTHAGDCSASVAGSLSTNSTKSKASSKISRSSSQQSSSATAIATDNDRSSVIQPATTTTEPASSSGAIPTTTVENRCSSPTTSMSTTTSKKLRRSEPEFFPQPSSPFYSYAVGRQSPYGDEVSAALIIIETTFISSSFHSSNLHSSLPHYLSHTIITHFFYLSVYMS